MQIQKVFSIYLLLLLCMSAFRLLRVIDKYSDGWRITELNDFFYALILGARFDLMVLAFTSLPCYLILLFLVQKKQMDVIALVSVKIYLIGIFLIISIVSGLVLRNWLIVLLLLIDSIVVFKIVQMDWEAPQSINYAHLEGVKFWKTVFVRIIIPLLLIFLAMRGNLLARHLNFDFSQFSNDPVLNQLSLNPFI